MKGRFALVVTAALLAACQPSPPPAAPDQPTPAVPAPDIKGLKLGDSQATVLAKFPKAECTTKGDTVSCHFGLVPYGGSPAPVYWVALTQDKAKLIAVTWLQEDKFDVLLSALTAKLGKPAEVQGPASAPAIVGWKQPGWAFVATRHEQQYRYSMVELVDMAWMQARQESAVQTAADDL